MSTEQIIRAWKDVRFRQSLSEDERALIPAHPAGTIELTASELTQISAEDDQEIEFTGATCTCTHCSDPLILNVRETSLSL